MDCTGHLRATIVKVPVFPDVHEIVKTSLVAHGVIPALSRAMELKDPRYESVVALINSCVDIGAHIRSNIEEVNDAAFLSALATDKGDRHQEISIHIQLEVRHVLREYLNFSKSSYFIQGRLTLLCCHSHSSLTWQIEMKY